MPANTPNGLPYPLPTEPVADGADAIKALALALDPRLPGTYALRARTLTGLSSDSQGIVSVTAATMGLTTLVGAAGGVMWVSTFDGATPHLSSVRLASNVIQILVMGLTSQSGGTVNRLVSKTGLTAYLIAWGVA